jgi:hypothetical protein
MLKLASSVRVGFSKFPTNNFQIKLKTKLQITNPLGLRVIPLQACPRETPWEVCLY